MANDTQTLTQEGQHTAYVRAAGAGEPVICLHSSASSSSQWRPLMDRVATRFQVFAIDLHGAGRTPGWSDDHPLSLADEAALVDPIMAGIRGRVHVVGHSYGAAVALKLALTHRSRIASLAVFEPVLFSVLMADDPEAPAAREICAVRADTADAVERGDLARAGERFVDYWMGAGSWARMPDTRRESVAAAMAAVPSEFDAAFSEPAPLEAFAALDFPVLSMVGSESPASSRAIARLVGKTLPRVTEIEIEGVGHMAPVTHADRVNALIEPHLDAGRERN